MSVLVEGLVKILRYWVLWTLLSGMYAFKTWTEFVELEKTPKEQEIASNEQVIRNKTAKVEKYQKQKSQIPEMQAQVKNLTSQLEVALAQLPRQFNMAQILRKMNELGKSSNLDFHRFRPTGEKTGPEGFYAELPIEMELRGTFPQILLFFDRIAKEEQRIFNISDIKISAIGPKNTGYHSRVTAVATTYRYVEEGGMR